MNIQYQNVTLILYEGDYVETEEKPHGNRRNNMNRAHIRTIKSKLEEMDCENDVPSNTYRLKIRANSNPAYDKVAKPKDI